MLNSNRFKYYGVLDGELGDYQIKVDIALVCGLLGNGSNDNADTLIQMTINSESQNGYAIDHSKNYGEGLGQFDRIAFDDVKARARQKHKDILKLLIIDVDNARYEDLRKSARLQIAFIRLKYLLIPQAVPTNFNDLYAYYKKYYNTENGKATFTHFQESNKHMFA